MKRCIFISRHEPTKEQTQMAKERGFALIHIGDRDAFQMAPHQLKKEHAADALAAVHPAAVLNSLGTFKTFLIFENANRAPVGEKPDFYCKNLHVFTIEKTMCVHHS